MTEHNRAEIEQSMDAWREDEGRVLAGQCMSAETRAESYAGHDRVDKKKLQILAEDYPEMFMRVVEGVSPLAQDVLIQHYLLRRTQTQIGQLLGLTQNALHYILNDAIEEVKGKRKPTKRDMRAATVNIRREKWLGAGEIPINEEVLEMCFQLPNGNV